jgi:predicted permease
MGVRAALGASRRRLVRQLVTESLALGTIAAALGLVLAYGAIPVVARMIEAPAGADLAPDLNVYLFLGVVTLLTGVGAGLAPAWYSRGTDLVTPLKGERAREGRAAPRRLRFLLVMTQAAVSVMLIALSTLFVRATVRAAAIDVGFVADDLYAVSSGPGFGAGNDAREFHARAVSELQTVPGIPAVSLAELSPFSGATMTAITREEPRRVIHFTGTDANYFETIGLRLLAGRIYTREEVTTNARVTLVSESLARAYWQGQSPLGQTLPQAIPVSTTPRPVVIGVVADAITADVYEGNTLAFYVPADPANSSVAELLIRGEPGAIDQVARRLRSIDPRADVRIASVAARLQQETSRPRMLAALTGMVGLFAIGLCAIGLYGLTASVVGQRAREMGVRVALGAVPRDLLRLLMWDSLRPVILGLAIGMATALLMGRVVVAAMFFGVSPTDPAAFGGAAAVLIVASAAAVLAPTRRAARLDPVSVLRRS